MSFDHALRANPEEIKNRSFVGPMTSFAIKHNEGLYAGLAFVPRSTLSTIANGLKDYLDEEALTWEQKDMVSLGIKLLEDRVNTKTSSR